jgi:hypothetical protein
MSKQSLYNIMYTAVKQGSGGRKLGGWLDSFPFLVVADIYPVHSIP